MKASGSTSPVAGFYPRIGRFTAVLVILVLRLVPIFVVVRVVVFAG